MPRRWVLLALLLARCGAPGGFESPTGCALEGRGVLAVALRDDVPLVQASIDGNPVTLKFDTGAERTLLTDATVVRLGLPRDAETDRVVGVGSSSEAAEADAKQFGLGSVVLRNRPIVVAAFPGAARPAEGLLGLDVLSHYDIDLDLPGRRVTLYRARICPDGTPPWGVHIATLAAHSGSHGQLQVPITLDGRDLQASIDSGSQTTTVALAALPLLGLSPGELARDPVLNVEGMSRGTTTVHEHRFGDLRIAGLLFRQPYIPVSPLPAFLGEALLGADVLRLHRVWLSWASERVWIEAER